MLPVIRTGLDTAMKNISTISNNIANANAIGFKRSRPEFADMYATAMETPKGSDLGLGARNVDIRRFHEQGSFRTTGAALDLAINGSGMFTLRNLESGDLLYSRDGSINITKDGALVSNEGHAFLDRDLEPIIIPFAIQRPDGTTGNLSELNVQTDGQINVSYGPQTTLTVARLGLALFEDEARLKSEGGNFYSETQRSGEMVMGAPLIGKAGYFQAGALETSNVDLTDEMTMMVGAQQAFNGSSRLMQSEAEMIRRLIG
jgi:flagellar hook protein FlgE